MDVTDIICWLLCLGLRHDCLRNNEHLATLALVFGMMQPPVELTVCSISACGIRSLYLSDVSHNGKEPVLDRDMAFSGMHPLTLPFNATLTWHCQGVV
jgi:hypothetical protein